VNKTPRKAILLKCKDCDADRERFKSDNFCINCQLKDTKLSNLKKIKQYCKWCLNGHRPDICSSPDCSLYIFKNGKNPNLKGNPNALF